jgi:hypothetical protein
MGASTAPIPCVKVHVLDISAEGGIRTRTGLPPLAFEASASAVPPLRLVQLDLQVHRDGEGLGLPAVGLHAVAAVVFLDDEAARGLVFLRALDDPGAAREALARDAHVDRRVAQDVFDPVRPVASAREHVEGARAGGDGEPYLDGVSLARYSPDRRQVAELFRCESFYCVQPDLLYRNLGGQVNENYRTARTPRTPRLGSNKGREHKGAKAQRRKGAKAQRRKDMLYVGRRRGGVYTGIGLRKRRYICLFHIL